MWLGNDYLTSGPHRRTTSAAALAFCRRPVDDVPSTDRPPRRVCLGWDNKVVRRHTLALLTAEGVNGRPNQCNDVSILSCMIHVPSNHCTQMLLFQANNCCSLTPTARVQVLLTFAWRCFRRAEMSSDHDTRSISVFHLSLPSFSRAIGCLTYLRSICR